MVCVRFRTPTGAEVEVNHAAGGTLLEAALAGDVSGIIGDCGGELSCGTCHVYVDDHFLNRLTVPSEDEQAMIEDGVIDPASNSRLCCQIVLDEALDGLVVTVGTNA